METIAIDGQAIATMLAEARAAFPDECCGLLLGRDGRIEEARPARNVHPEPATRFEIDPHALIAAHRAERTDGPRVCGYYHSHPEGAAEPSAVDRARAAGDRMIWAIIAGEAIGLWRDGPQGFARLARMPLPSPAMRG